MSNKFDIQNSQFNFPYHYIPNFLENGFPVPYRWYPKALEYLCYQRYVQKKIEKYPSSSILEIGCGDGRFCYDLPGERKKNYVGVDLSKRAIELARVFNPGVRFEVGEANNIVGSFDIVLAIEVLEHVQDSLVEDFVRTMESKMTLGGIAIICVPSTNKALIEKHYRHYTTEDLVKAVTSSTPSLECLSADYVFKYDWVLSIWERFSRNSYFNLDIHKLREKIWEHCIRNCMIANEDDGQHVIATFIRR